MTAPRGPHVFAHAGVATGIGTAHSPESIAKEPAPAYRGGSLKKPARERRLGMSLTRDDGIERSRLREYDRLGNRYHERILNPDGSVYFETSEPLSDHRGHGSDKPK
jgi:hypothetical protein